MPSNKTPRGLGFRMPAEWEPHEGTWLSWPKDPVTFPKRVRKVEQVYCAMMRHLAEGEKVFLLVDDEVTQTRVARMLSEQGVNLGNIVIHVIPTVDVWIRDYGPNFIIREDKSGGREKDLAFNHWIFNAWGGKYDELIPDTHVPELLKPLLNVPAFEPGIVMEGGSIDVNGKGICLTTTQCLLNKNRNPQLNQRQIELYLKDYLGVQEVVWLGEGVEGDDTDGHVDDIARFVAPDTVACALEDNPKDSNYKPLRENYETLQAKFQTVPLPMPGRIRGRGARLPASYANFLIGNACVLVPTFQDPNDEKALGILAELFPQRRIAGIDCKDLIWGMGAVHCVSQQQPKI